MRVLPLRHPQSLFLSGALSPCRPLLVFQFHAADLFRHFPLPLLVHFQPRGDLEVICRAAVGLLNQLQRLDRWNADVDGLVNGLVDLDQGGECLGGNFLEVRQGDTSFAGREGVGDGDRVRGFESGECGKGAVLPVSHRHEGLGGGGVEPGQAVEQECLALELRERSGRVAVEPGQRAKA